MLELILKISLLIEKNILVFYTSGIYFLVSEIMAKID